MRRVLPALLLIAAVAATIAPPSTAATRAANRAWTIRVIPAMQGVRVIYGGRAFVTDERGRVRVEAASADAIERTARVPTQKVGDGIRVEHDRWYPGLEIALDVYRRVSFSFTDRRGVEIETESISTMTLKSTVGGVYTFRDDEIAAAHWLHAQRVTTVQAGALTRPIEYSVQRVTVEGANVVNRSQQRFDPGEVQDIPIWLLFFPAEFEVRDALFGFPIGSSLRLTFPDGRQLVVPIVDGHASVKSLPRGEYEVSVDGAGLTLSVPLALSRPQSAEIMFLSYVDLSAALLVSLAFLVGLPLTAGAVRRRRARRVAHRDQPSTVRRRAVSVSAIAIVVTVFAGSSSVRAATQPETPMFAYYYIWFDATSWERAKTDHPILGNYSSDLDSVMRQHIEWAKAAGIDGFIVSWKSTQVLNPRLATLAAIAQEENFKLAVMYQGLDFYRRPLPVGRVAADLRYFADEFASLPAFDVYEKPLVVWSGTWEFSAEEIERATAGVRTDLLVMATEKTPEDYGRIADLVDGEAYYWSSVNPDTYPDYPGKLREMSDVVDRHGDRWIAPVAPGFDARLVGGTAVVPREDGKTLRREYEAALASSPDMLGLISWNEFSENTHVEPSENFGTRSLDVLSAIQGATLEVGEGFDSSEPSGVSRSPTRFLLLLATGLGGVLLVTSIGARRRGEEEG